MDRGQDLGFGFMPGADEEPQLEKHITTAMNNTIDDALVDISGLTDKQDKALAVLQVCSASLSLVGSCMIVFKIISSLCGNRKTSPYDRIIFGLSICDIFGSCTYIMAPFLLPSETSVRIWASGSDRTCQQLGLMTQLFCIWALWYNAILSFYYLLTVRFQVKRRQFCRKYELWMHLIGIIFFPVTAFTGYFNDWYAEEALAMGCWVGPADGHGELIAYIYGAVPMVITIISLIVNNIVIYVYVRRNLLFSSPKTNDDDDESNEIRSESLKSTNPRSESGKSSNTVDGLETGDARESGERQSIQEHLTREAAIQGFLYVSTFLITFIPMFVVLILNGSMGYDTEDQAQLYPLLVLNAMLLPLQGFFNVFIYVRPTYNRFSAAYPDLSFWINIRLALFDPDIPRMTSIEGFSSSYPTSKKQSNVKKRSGGNFLSTLHNIEEEKKVNTNGSIEVLVSTASEPSNDCSHKSSVMFEKTRDFFDDIYSRKKLGI